MDKQYLTVSAVSKYIKYKFDNDVHLKNIHLEGEVSNFKRNSMVLWTLSQCFSELCHNNNDINYHVQSK